MSNKCLIWTCKNKGDIPGITYHGLKKNRYAPWLRAIGRSPDEDLFSTNVICSKHFRPEDFCFKGGKVDLKDGAVPTQHLPRNAVLLNAVLKEITQPTDINEPPAKNIRIDLEQKDEQIYSGNNKSQPGSSSAMDFLKNKNDADVASDGFVRAIHSYATTPEILERKLRTATKNENFRNYNRIEIESDMEINENRAKTQNMAYYSSVSVEKLREDLKRERERKRMVRIKKRVEQQRKRRIHVRVSRLQRAINIFKEKRMLSDDACALLEKTFSDLPVVTGTKKEYSTLRSFAMTLHFFSSKAYEYARTNFKLPLPPQMRIRSRYSNVSCDPGFAKAAFQALKNKFKYNSTRGLDTLCNLTMDEMPLKRQIEYFNRKTWGYIDMNTSLKEDDTLQVATRALVLMVVSLTEQWKLPVAYFFVHSLTTDEKANIVKETLIKLHSCGIIVTSVTCDGPTANFSMMQRLGGHFNDVEDIVPYFPHPADADLKVFIIFDACRMVKNMQNTWKVVKKFVDPGGNEVDFKYVEMLENIQEGNDTSQKLKVNIDFGTLNESIAIALAKIRDPKFKEVSATIKFIRLVGNVSDVLNSKSPFTRGTKMPIEWDNEEEWLPLFQKAIRYFTNCTVENSSISSTNKQNSFKGLIFTIFSVIGIYETYVKPGDAKLKCLLTHKLSQDHLEQFFKSIRSTNICNSNPSAWQFRNIYKRHLLSYGDIKAVNGNVAV